MKIFRTCEPNHNLKYQEMKLIIEGIELEKEKKKGKKKEKGSEEERVGGSLLSRAARTRIDYHLLDNSSQCNTCGSWKFVCDILGWPQLFILRRLYIYIYIYLIQPNWVINLSTRVSTSQMPQFHRQFGTGLFTTAIFKF